MQEETERRCPHCGSSIGAYKKLKHIQVPRRKEEEFKERKNNPVFIENEKSVLICLECGKKI